ncbi:Alpha/Beta hydrolase protein [Dimargaris cristalligena]|uniref:Carboxypeptidase n=1 Tax=Dimargaris cristalligena TaxID=215637 RepID=A0A4P9ZTW0_9FUNG|nr:Alpha/Beta hydrolase protein [Dimargaris cristalligena]|eukprot:RKP36947.1 Alpha/Beta hydrolase protein [Dimargaris cristalligena]
MQLQFQPSLPLNSGIHLDGSFRIREPRLCTNHTHHYAGYLDFANDTRHTFFWLFESELDPPNDPLVLWLSGGPGCAGTVGLFEELGPCQIDPQDHQKVRPRTHAWNKRANLLFIDQPSNTGFSYRTPAPFNDPNAQPVGTSTEAALDLISFLQAFYHRFPQYRDSPLHLFGESYAGHYLPILAQHILTLNQRQPIPYRDYIRLPFVKPHDHLRSQIFPIRLASIGIGNGLLDFLTQIPSYYTMACKAPLQPHSEPPSPSGPTTLFTPAQCADLAAHTPVCLRALESCHQSRDLHRCRQAKRYCAHFSFRYTNHTTIYDVRAAARPVPVDYKGYLNRPDVQAELGVHRSYTDCNDEVYRDFERRGDWAGREPLQALGSLLEMGLPILMYTGDADFICNWLGTLAVAQAAQWSGQAGFEAQTWRPWSPQDHVQGHIRSFRHFTYLKISEAGHEVPAYQPAASLAMLNTWLQKQQL